MSEDPEEESKAQLLAMLGGQGQRPNPSPTPTPAPPFKGTVVDAMHYWSKTGKGFGGATMNHFLPSFYLEKHESLKNANILIEDLRGKLADSEKRVGDLRVEAANKHWETVSLSKQIDALKAQQQVEKTLSKFLFSASTFCISLGVGLIKDSIGAGITLIVAGAISFILALKPSLLDRASKVNAKEQGKANEKGTAS